MSNRKSSQRRNRRKSTKTYQLLEPKQLLATFTVTTISDVLGTSPDGEVSLREAIIAANTNQAFGDAPAGDALGDRIVFDSSLAGETISLTGSSIVITEGLTINGTDRGITIDAASQSRVFAIDTNEEVILRGFAINNGRDVEGGAIYTQGGGTLRLIGMDFDGNGGNQFEDTFTEKGGAVFNLDSTVVLTNSIFSGNTSLQGGAIYSVSGAMRSFGSTFDSNNASRSGGAISIEAGDYFFGDTEFSKNSAIDAFSYSGPGGAIFSGATANIFINDGSFEGNSGFSGGAIYNTGESVMDIRDGVTFTDNLAAGNRETNVPPDGEGGAIYNRSEMRVVGAVFESNTAAFGGGIFSNNGNTLINFMEARSNTGTELGGAVGVRGGLTRIVEPTIGGRTAADGNSSGSDLVQGVRGYGGGIGATEAAGSDDPTVVRVIGGEISNNSAFVLGGGIANLGDSTFQVIGGTRIDGNRVENTTDRAVSRGGGVFSSGNMLVAADTEIKNNRSLHYGGGIFVADGNFNLDSSKVSANQANVRGGGMEVAGGDVRLFATTIGGGLADGNVAGTYGADGLPGRGGGIYMSGDEGTRFRMIKGEISGNTATVAGGGMWNNPGNVIRLENGVEVSGNRALREDGGGAYNHGGHYEIRDALFSDNLSRNGAGFFNNVGSARFINSSLQSNTARSSGGGLYNRSFFLLANSEVSDNLAISFADIFDETI